MEDRRIPWPLVGLAALLAAAGVAGVATLTTPHRPTVDDGYGLVAPTLTQPFDLSSAAPRHYRGGPPGGLARDNAEYPVGTGPSDELLPGRWAAYPTGRDCKWLVEIPPAPGVEMLMVTQPDGRQEIHTTQWVAGSTETHFTPGTAIYVQLDAGVRFQTVNCGTWFRTDRPTPSPRIR